MDMYDDTLDFINGLIAKTKNKKLSKILKCIRDFSPSEDLGYGDWNDRQDFYENEYDSLVSDALKKLEKLVD